MPGHRFFGGYVVTGRHSGEGLRGWVLRLALIRVGMGRELPELIMLLASISEMGYYDNNPSQPRSTRRPSLTCL
jgi:hypothetical protein